MKKFIKQMISSLAMQKAPLIVEREYLIKKGVIRY
jgi:hypothetical protein